MRLSMITQASNSDGWQTIICCDATEFVRRVNCLESENYFRANGMDERSTQRVPSASGFMRLGA
jgi:hypothetical protein